MTTPQPIVIIGAGGHGREAADIVAAMNEVESRFEILGFLDDGRKPGEQVAPHSFEILGGIEVMDRLDVPFVPAIGKTDVRRRIVARLPGRETVDLIHPSATIGSHVRHGGGLILAAGARITHAVELGEHVHVNVNATISHDCRIGSFVTITPGVHISGGAVLGSGVWMGIGSSVIQLVRIGDNVTVGAGAAVIEDVSPDCTVVGVPARPVTRH